MKRILAAVGLLIVLGVIAWLAVTRHLSQQRAARLDKALMDTEARLMQMESDLESAKQRIAELTAAQTNIAVPAAGGASAGASNATAAATGGANPTAWTRFAATASGVTNLVRIEGTSSVHKWQVEGHLIGGSAEFAPAFPVKPGEQANPGAVEAKVTAFIPVRSLKSVEDDGKPYSSAMDEIMYGKLRTENFPRITYRLKSLTSKGQAAGGLAYEAVGTLDLAGATNTVTMPVTVSPQPNGKIRFSGSLETKMSDFGITPPSPSLGGVSITTGDAVVLRFEWWVAPITNQANK